MINLIYNWRKYLLLCLYFFIFINTFSFQMKQMSAEFWIENQKYLGLSCRTRMISVLRKKRLSQCLLHSLAFIKFYKHIFTHRYNEFSLLMTFYLFKFVGLLWINLLNRIVCQMNNCGLINNNGFEINWSSFKTVKDIPFHICLNVVFGQININTSVLKVYNDEFQNKNISETINIDYKTISCETQEIVNETTNSLIDDLNEVSLLSKIENQNGSCSGYFKFDDNIKDITLYQTEMKRFFNSLSEKDRRRYAGIEALKLGHGGKTYIADVLCCSTKTILRGIKEINDLPQDIGNRVRRSGGGRKPLSKIHGKKLDNAFLDVMEHHTAGDPMNSQLLWTNLSRLKISELLDDRYQINVSETVIKKLLKTHNFGTRKAIKGQTKKSVANRNDQFETIIVYKYEYASNGDPVISMDSKKREHLTLYRDGRLYTQKTVITPDHDFPSYSKGSFTPHGIWDVNKNKGYISIGISKDTSEFACDSLRSWWYNQGQFDYKQSTKLLILCDGGGSNSSRSNLFKQDIQRLANELQLEIRIAHYPPYCSKYNPIEHRMFPHVTKACQGVIFESFEQANEYIKTTKTKEGLIVNSVIIKKEYEKGRKVDKKIIETLNIRYDDHLKSWNYQISPIR